jgi:hypothetical protein
MNGTIDVDQAATDDEGGLDPQRAAALLEETGKQAKRELEFDPPFLSLLGAAMILIAYGGLYMAARGERHYTGPRGPWLLVVPAVIIASWILHTTRFDRMSATLTGGTMRRWRVTGGVLVVAVICVYTLDGALMHAGASKAIVYGVFDASGPILVFSTLAAANAAWREDWPAVGVTVALMIVATGAAFAGPARAWGVIGVGGCVALLAHAAVKIWLQRHDG